MPTIDEVRVGARFVHGDVELVQPAGRRRSGTPPSRLGPRTRPVSSSDPAAGLSASYLIVGEGMGAIQPRFTNV